MTKPGIRRSGYTPFITPGQLGESMSAKAACCSLERNNPFFLRIAPSHVGPILPKCGGGFHIRLLYIYKFPGNRLAGRGGRSLVCTRRGWNEPVAKQPELAVIGRQTILNLARGHGKGACALSMELCICVQTQICRYLSFRCLGLFSSGVEGAAKKSGGFALL